MTLDDIIVWKWTKLDTENADFDENDWIEFFIHEITLVPGCDWTHEEDLSSFDRDGCAGDQLEIVVDALIDVGDAVMRQEGMAKRENTCKKRDLHRIWIILSSNGCYHFPTY